MAKGSAFGRFELALGIVGLAALVVAYSMVTGKNPLPTLQGWLDRARVLSEPAPVWSVKLADQPSSAVAAGNVWVIVSNGSVAGYTLDSGQLMWTHQGDWSAVAGTGSGAVVVVGKPGGHGYETFNPATGAPKWTDGAALGVWTFADAVIGVACPQPTSCTLTARDPADGKVRWTSTMPGDGRTLAGVNRRLAGIRPLSRADPAPQRVPPLLGFVTDDGVRVVDPGNGALLHTYPSTPTSRPAVAGDRVVLTSATGRDSACHPEVDARDPHRDRSVWHRTGYDLHTFSALGCEQRADPIGGGGLLAATAADGREVLLNPDSGAEVFRADQGESIVDANPRLAVVRMADRRKIRAVDLATGRTAWSWAVDKSVVIALGPAVVVLNDPSTGRLAVLSAAGKLLVDAASDATVLGYSDHGLLVNSGRLTGLLGYRS